MSQPRTAVGRALLEHMTEDAAGFVTVTSGRFHIRWVLDALAKDIPAIEAEAIAAERARLAEAVRGLPFRRMTGGGLEEGGTTGDLSWDWDEWDDVVSSAAVLALLDDPA